MTSLESKLLAQNKLLQGRLEFEEALNKQQQIKVKELSNQLDTYKVAEMLRLAQLKKSNNLVARLEKDIYILEEAARCLNVPLLHEVV